MPDNLFSKRFASRNNDAAAPVSIVRPGALSTTSVQNGVVPEYFEGLISENGANTYDLDFLVPAGATIIWLGVYAQALWTAATSATLNVGDYTNVATPVAIDADGFFAAVNLKATDLLVGESLTLLGSGQGGKAGAYLGGTATHWTNLYSATARIIRFSVASVGAGTAGRTRCTVGYIHPAGTFSTINS